MAISYRGVGSVSNSTTAPNPTYVAGVLAQDLNMLYVQFRSGTGATPLGEPITPTGYVKVGRVGFLGMHQYVYWRIGSFSGSLGAIGWTGTLPTVASAFIITWTCNVGETWDTASWGVDGVNGIGGQTYGTWSHGGDGYYNTNYSGQAKYAGTNGAGRFDPGPGDYIINNTIISDATTIQDWGYNPGSGVTAGTEVVSVRVGSVVGANEFESFVSYRPITAATGAYGPPGVNFTTPYRNVAGFGMHFKITLNEKTAVDTSAATDTTKASGITSDDPTSAAVDAESVRTGVNVPAGRVWTNDEIPDTSAGSDTDPNEYWRKPLRWLLGRSAPGIRCVAANTAIAGGSTWTKVQWSSETYKVNGMLHDNAVNNTRITVPEDGWYSGSVLLFLNTDGTLSAESRSVAILRNGGTGPTQLVAPRAKLPLAADENQESMVPFNIFLLANDYIEVGFFATGASGHTSLFGTSSFISMWWDSK